MKLSFQQKLWAPLVCSLVCISAIFVFDALQIRDVRIEERSRDLKNIDDAGIGVVKLYADQVQAGRLDKADGQKQALAALKAMRYGKDGYISVNNGDAISLMNPPSPRTTARTSAISKIPRARICSATSSPPARARKAAASSTITGCGRTPANRCPR